MDEYKIPEIYQTIIRTEKNMENHYDKFWINIYYNDAYVYFKHAINFYKNTQNRKYHSFFSNIINAKLYDGKFKYINKSDRKDWYDKNVTYDIPDLDDIYRVSIQTINLLDQIFDICPKLPTDIITYRFENRTNNNIPKFKKGLLYKSFGYMSTTIMPYYLNELFFVLRNRKNLEGTIKIIFIIYIPESSKGYYMNNPYGSYNDQSLDKTIGAQEHEILLPRENVYEIMEIDNRDKVKFICMRLYAQAKRLSEITEENTEKTIMNTIITKNELKMENCDLMKEMNVEPIKTNYQMKIYEEYEKILVDGYNITKLNDIIQANRVIKFTKKRNKYIE